jgi:hypothetical protein
MVSVSYGQGGGNGAGSGFATANSGRTQATLPYKIMNGGAFRPPIVTQQMTYPLSRMPRNTTSAFTQKSFPDFQKKMRCPQKAEKTVGVKNSQLKVCVRPTRTIKFETPLIEPFEVKYVIQNPVKVSGNSGMRTRDLTTQEVLKPTKEVYIDPTHTSANANQGSNRTVKHLNNNYMNTERYVQNTLNKSAQSGVVYYDKTTFADDNNVQTDRYMQNAMNVTANSGVYQNKARLTDNTSFETDRYLQDANHSNVMSQKSQNINVTSIEDIMDVDIRTKDVIHVPYTAPVSSTNYENYIHDDIELRRRAPNVHAVTNKKQNIYVRHEEPHVKTLQRNRPMVQANSRLGTIGIQKDVQMERNYTLRPTLRPGSFQSRGQKPMINKVNKIESLNSHRETMNKKVHEQMMGRYGN